ncbi:patatin-like phospholipase family protein [Microbacterium jejuense]|uniref:Patatin-like phospholipase family protein n=1 Tax=Microbacterium jejuense TaxID=1263637 RepID=A0ABS7HNZ4_9MICO|nr:patatin-like phospholipase family protein [Microbacterium jejuense]MBW9094578.1 patatin-like phospholipase family protein [Microbacterium jejuense]
MNNTFSPTRALVLGGGGSTGNAWLIGIVAGLFEAGVDVTTADLTIGTSAGATAAAQLAGAATAELYALTVAPPPARPDPRQGPAFSSRPGVDHLERTGRIIAESADAADMRRRMGTSAIELAVADPDWQPRWRRTVAARLPDPRWPERPVQLTVVDARTGEGVALDRDSGVDLVDAVAASTAGGAAYRIGEDWYIDGGYRTNADNADLAAGFDRVLVLSPFGGRTRTPAEWGLDLATQVEALRAEGSRVEVVGPPAEAEHLFVHAMNAALRPAAAETGHAQGLALAASLDEFWR